MKKYFLIIILQLFPLSLFPQPSLDDSLDVNGFLDGSLKSIMEENHIAGATAVLVRNGEVLYLKGHGYSDVERRQPVDPAHTLFRIGSISKLFVWTAIMQLYEQGKLSLEDPVEKYLDLDIPDSYPEPITIRHLMTHTPGFEDHVLNLFARDSAAMRPIGDILKEEMPDRVLPPGEFASYSNHGTGMAALIVEKLSGMDFMDYVNAYIIGPLGMNQTTFAQPLPAGLKDQMSKGYLYENHCYVAQAFEFVPLYPVGGASSTALDMVRFMKAHLQLGQFKGRSILDSATATLMQSPAFSHADGLNPMLLGFYEMSQNGIRIFGHGGDTFWFHSLMALFPEQNMVLFLSFNSQAGSGQANQVLEDFMDRYFPEEVEEISPTASEELEEYEGVYAANRYSHDDLFKISRLMISGEVSINSEGYLELTAMGDKEEYVRIDEDRFRNRDHSGEIVFRRGESGEIAYLFIDQLPIIAMEKLGATETPAFQITLLILPLLIILFSLMYWMLAGLIKKKYDITEIGASHIPKNARYVAWFAALMVIIYYVGLGVFFSNPFDLVFGIPGSMKIILFIPYLIIILVLGMLWMLYIMWRDREVSIWNRLLYSLLMIALVASLWQWDYWNLIGY